MNNTVSVHHLLHYDILQVDYASDPVILLKPQKVVIRRSFHNGIWLQYRTSAHQAQLHVMLHHLQVLLLFLSQCSRIQAAFMSLFCAQQSSYSL